MAARIGNRAYLEHMDEAWLLATQTKLQDSLAILEKHRTSISRINYEDTCKTYGKTYRISNSRELSAKIYYCATWSDKHNMITGIIDSLESRQATDFPKAIKRLSSNIVIADMINGPVSGTIIEKNRRFENNWYNILTKSVRIALRANAHFLNALAKIKEDAIKKQIEEEERKQKEKEEKSQQEAEEKEKMRDAELLQKIENVEILDSWEDF